MGARGERPTATRLTFGALLGGGVGFGVGAALYTALSTLLEARGGALEELQGLTWNLVPLLTVLGALFGVWLVHRHDADHDIGTRR